MTETEIVLIADGDVITDDWGNQEVTETETTVFATVESVSGSEQVAARQVQLRPVYKVTVWAFEYHGERKAELDGVRYVIYRTYTRPDERCELYLSEKEGVVDE